MVSTFSSNDFFSQNIPLRNYTNLQFVHVYEIVKLQLSWLCFHPVTTTMTTTLTRTCSVNKVNSVEFDVTGGRCIFSNKYKMILEKWSSISNHLTWLTAGLWANGKLGKHINGERGEAKWLIIIGRYEWLIYFPPNVLNIGIHHIINFLNGILLR